MIGVSRRQTGSAATTAPDSLYRYYQCESRTNQGTAPTTHNADELEEAMRLQLSELDLAVAIAGDDHAVLAWQSESRRLHDKLQQVDRRLRSNRSAAASDIGAEAALQRPGARRRTHAVEEDYRRVTPSIRLRRAAAPQRRAEMLVADEIYPDGRQQLLREIIDTSAPVNPASASPSVLMATLSITRP
jgi:hypothetical protein